MDKKTKYPEDISSSHLDVQIQQNKKKNPNKLFSEYTKTQYNIYMERQKIYNSHRILKEENKVGRPNMKTFLKNSLAVSYKTKHTLTT